MLQNQSSVAQLIDHTLLRADCTSQEIQKLCAEAKEYGFFSVCIHPFFIDQAKIELSGSAVKICTVIGFPLGANLTSTKATECEQALAAGANEVDMVINISALKDKRDSVILEDIKGVVTAARGCPVKVILETALLNEQEKILACELAKEAGAQYVKTSTGFARPAHGPAGATVEDIRLLRTIVGPEMGVKASGGIRDLATATAMIAAGATRLGTSNSVAIVGATTLITGDY
ncbi:MAG: deoxyribose-phosphate aldolase [Pseudobdellovibrionaceae bacterium]|nr:deoxyribose-phosphate aldolase [Bdellovibrionales bacterium]USN46894.1 MAG: deoxyribose-phosphate aldolase [Pseudobdellovibrionaceae bacterium]